MANYKEQLFAEMDRLLGEIAEVAGDFQRMAQENRVFLEGYTERRSDPRRPNRCPSYSEQKEQRTAK